jgi:hypothetical protein
MQRSGATPLGAKTTTTPAGKAEPKKDIDAIIAAHNPPYQATACASYPQDLFRKVKKASPSMARHSSTYSHPALPAGDIRLKKPLKSAGLR